MTEDLVIEAASDLYELVSATPTKHQVSRDKAIRNSLRKVQKLARTRFRAQRKAVLDSHALHTLPMTEADDPERTRREDRIEAVFGPIIYHQPVTAAEQDTFAHAVSIAIENGGEAAADMLGATSPDAESFIAEYLKDGGFSRLTGELDKTTVDDLAKAVADAYDSGEDFEGVVKAVRDSFAKASNYRAKMIAQTELNDAWNQSLFHFGKEAGATRKSWATDIAPCPICIANAADGQIDFDSDFSSGDDAPPGHPNCFCSLEVHA